MSLLEISPVSVIQKEEPLKGIFTWINPKNGFCVIDLKYWADPNKRSEEWLLMAKSGIPSAEFDREYGDKWIIYDGKPVYGSDFNDGDNGNVVRGPIVSTRRARLISGWDAGPTDLNLAWTLGIVQPSERRITFIDEYYTDDGDVDDFVQVVANRLKLEWLKLGGFSLHFADPSINTESNGRSVAKVMRAHGLYPQNGEVSFALRKKAVFELLTHTKMGRPLLLVHERCSTLIEAFKGGYCYPKLPSVGSGGMYREMPLKNKFSHIANAAEYATSRVDNASYNIPYEGKRLPYASVV